MNPGDLVKNSETGQLGVLTDGQRFADGKVWLTVTLEDSTSVEWAARYTFMRDRKDNDGSRAAKRNG